MNRFIKIIYFGTFLIGVLLLASNAFAQCPNPMNDCSASCGTTCYYDTCVTETTTITQLPVTIYPITTGSPPCTGTNKTIETIPFIDDLGNSNKTLPSPTSTGISFTWCKTTAKSGGCPIYAAWCFINPSGASFTVPLPGVFATGVSGCEHNVPDCAPYCGQYSVGASVPWRDGYITCVNSATPLNGSECSAVNGDSMCTASSENCSNSPGDCGSCTSP